MHWCIQVVAQYELKQQTSTSKDFMLCDVMFVVMCAFKMKTIMGTNFQYYYYYNFA